MSTLVNSEGPDEMLHDRAFYQGLKCLLLSCQVRVTVT